MPLITELPVTVLSHYFSADYLAVRSQGPHLKVIVDDWLEYHELARRKRSPEFGEALQEFGSLGFAWERAAMKAIELGEALGITEATPQAVRRIYEHVFSRAFNAAESERRSKELVRVGEITHRGIHCTLDNANVREELVDEWKATWASAAGGLEAHPDWLMQVPGYCSAIGFDTAIIRAFFTNGYYEKAQMGRPVVRAWKLRWSEEELEENWQLLEDHRGVMIEEGRAEWGMAEHDGHKHGGRDGKGK